QPDRTGLQHRRAAGSAASGRHPEQVSVLIAHDLATPALLPAADRARIEQTLADIEAPGPAAQSHAVVVVAPASAYRRDGLPAALRMLAAATGLNMDAMDREPVVVPQPTTGARVANMDLFLTNQRPESAERERLRGGGGGEGAGKRRTDRAAAGERCHGAWNYQCAEILASLTGSEVVEFPGGHNGNTMFPRAFAARLLEVLQTTQSVPGGGAVGG
ncbi:MAG: hypothetical protein QOH03_1705, partial [Kribbellaceae bacterium]|nr:hypothetical protein [Kribbellaceae bacterium]